MDPKYASLQATISSAFSDRSLLNDSAVRTAVNRAIAGLDCGDLRVAEQGDDGAWTVNAWLKEAILLYFLLHESTSSEAGPLAFFDKIPVKNKWAGSGVRVVPPGTARYGSYLAPGVILMPGFVNIGAWVGEGTMVDTWATVGSCAQIGAGVHLSGGVGIGGVLEPPNARPVIVEDGAFIGSRCVIVEGVIVQREAVLGAGVVLTASTPIIDVTGPEPKSIKGTIPARAVVIPGTQDKQFAAGVYGTPCALIIGQRSAATDKKTSLNDALREYGLAV
jgi:2,3,4,5-tetrahydropyridine-2-carboxylate N-succinyltransferase